VVHVAVDVAHELVGAITRTDMMARAGPAGLAHALLEGTGAGDLERDFRGIHVMVDPS